MKIIQVTPYYPPHQGGMEQVVKNISEVLTNYSIDTVVYTSSIGDRPHTLNVNSHLTVNFLYGFEIAHTPIIPSLFWKLLLLPKDSIIHVHIAQAIIPEIVWMVCKIRGLHYITQLHLDVLPSGFFGFLLHPYKKYVLSYILRKSSRVICLNDADKTTIINKYKVNSFNIQVLPNGVDSKFFIKRIINRKVTNLLYVGRLSVQKNIHLLIESMKFMDNTVHLNIVGDGDQREFLRNLIIKYSLENQVAMHGNLTGNTLINFYNKSDILLLSSLNESFALVILEAMASGLPIIAPALSTLESLWGKNIVYVNELTPEGYSKVIHKVMSDYSLRKYLSESGTKEAKKHEWKQIVLNYVKIYKSL